MNEKWLTPGIPAPRKRRQENLEFKAKLGQWPKTNGPTTVS